MESDQTASVEGLIARVRDGEAAQRQLLDQVYARLERLARKMFREDFPALGGQHETGSVLSETWLRLRQAWPDVRPATADDFFKLAALKVRHVLLDMARRYRREEARRAPAGDVTALPAGDDPAELAAWAEFHQQMDELPPDLKAVADLHWYLDLSFPEVARVLKIGEGVAKFRWKKAKAKLARWVRPGEGGTC